MPPPVSLEFHEFKCGLSPVIALSPVVGLLVDVADFLKSLYNEELFFSAYLTGSLTRLVFTTLFQN